jgi:hypothetical protein
MYQLFYTPSWFNGWDVVFEALGLIVTLLIAGYSWKCFKISNENRFAYFSCAFLLVSLGLAFKMFTHAVLYYQPLRDSVVTVLGPATGQNLQFADLFYRGAFFFQMLAMLGAWLLIFFISQKPRERLKKFYEISQLALFVYLILLISVVSNFKYTVFYLTNSVLLGLITLNYYKNYLNNNFNKNSFRVMLAFLFILLANISLVFVFLFENLYVAGEILLLIGFLLLLTTYRRISRK